jgi:hypothetical protein
MSKVDKLLSEVLLLETREKLTLVDSLLASIYPVSQGVETLWSEEGEERLRSHEKGLLPTIDEETTFDKYKR